VWRSPPPPPPPPPPPSTVIIILYYVVADATAIIFRAYTYTPYRYIRARKRDARRCDVFYYNILIKKPLFAHAQCCYRGWWFNAPEKMTKYSCDNAPKIVENHRNMRSIRARKISLKLPVEFTSSKKKSWLFREKTIKMVHTLAKKINCYATHFILDVVILENSRILLFLKKKKTHYEHIIIVQNQLL